MRATNYNSVAANIFVFSLFSQSPLHRLPDTSPQILHTSEHPFSLPPPAKGPLPGLAAKGSPSATHLHRPGRQGSHTPSCPLTGANPPLGLDHIPSPYLTTAQPPRPTLVCLTPDPTYPCPDITPVPQPSSDAPGPCDWCPLCMLD